MNVLKIFCALALCMLASTHVAATDPYHIWFDNYPADTTLGRNFFTPGLPGDKIALSQSFYLFNPHTDEDGKFEIYVTDLDDKNIEKARIVNGDWRVTLAPNKKRLVILNFEAEVGKKYYICASIKTASKPRAVNILCGSVSIKSSLQD